MQLGATDPVVGLGDSVQTPPQNQSLNNTHKKVASLKHTERDIGEAREKREGEGKKRSAGNISNTFSEGTRSLDLNSSAELRGSKLIYTCIDNS
jgi:hypothetical protein